MVIALLFTVVIGVVALARAYGEIDEDFVHDWADAHALTLTSANRPLVWWYLRNARVLRTWGVLAALLLPALVMAALGVDTGESVDATWAFVFGGHFVGALYAEVALRRPGPSATRTASLERREVQQYLPTRLRLAPVVVGALVVAVAALGWTAGIDPSDHTLLMAAVGSTPIIVLMVASAQRWIVRRPQPFSAPDLVAADDAIRSQSIHMLAGSGTAVLLSLLGVVSWAVARGDATGTTAMVVGFVGLATIPLALVSCLYYGHRAWRVLRTPFLRDAATTS